MQGQSANRPYRGSRGCEGDCPKVYGALCTVESGLRIRPTIKEFLS